MFLKVLALLALASTTLGEEVEFEINDKKVYSLLPETKEDLYFLKELQKSESSVIFWNGIGEIGEPVDILASEAALTEMLHGAPPPLIKSLVLKHSKVEIEFHSCGSEEASDNKVAKESSPIPVETIHGTNLTTGTFYNIGLRRFHLGYLRVAPDRHNATGHHDYVIIQDLLSDKAEFQKGGSSYNSIQWYFAPSSIEGWYTIRHRQSERNGLPSPAYATWSREKAANDLTYVHIVMRQNDEDVDSSDNYLWKPVETEDAGKYRLVLKAFPKDFVTCTNQEHDGKSAHYLQVEVSDDMKYRTNYDKGNKWWEGTLFTFQEIEVDLEAKITQIEVHTGSVIQDGLMPLLMKTECNSDKNITLSNRGSVEMIQSTEVTSKVEGMLNLKLDGDLSQFSRVVISGAKASAPWSANYFQVYNPNENSKLSLQDQLVTKEAIKFSTDLVVPSWQSRTFAVCRQYIELSETDESMPASATIEVSCTTDRPLERFEGVTKSRVASSCAENKFEGDARVWKLLGKQHKAMIYTVPGSVPRGMFGFQGIIVPMLK